jgi:hypothetical protein
MNKNYKAQLWAREIGKWSVKYVGHSIDVFSKSRKMHTVQYRALHIFMLRKYLKFSLYRIRDFYVANGMRESYNHASVLHALNMFEIYKHYDPNLMECLMLIINDHESETDTLRNLQTKLNFIYPAFYTDVIPSINDAYQKTIEIIELQIKQKENDLQSENK